MAAWGQAPTPLRSRPPEHARLSPTQDRPCIFHEVLALVTSAAKQSEQSKRICGTIRSESLQLVIRLFIRRRGRANGRQRFSYKEANNVLQVLRQAASGYSAILRRLRRRCEQWRSGRNATLPAT